MLTMNVDGYFVYFLHKITIEPHIFGLYHDHWRNYWYGLTENYYWIIISGQNKTLNTHFCKDSTSFLLIILISFKTFTELHWRVLQAKRNKTFFAHRGGRAHFGHMLVSRFFRWTLWWKVAWFWRNVVWAVRSQ